MTTSDEMQRSQTVLLRYALAAMVLATVLMAPGIELLLPLDRGFQPRAVVYGPSRFLVIAHLISDLLIGGAYIAISLSLVYLARKVGTRLPFMWTFVAFGVFIISCGFTHLVTAFTLYHPVYWAAFVIKVVTAIASVATAIAVPPLIPRVLRLLSQAREVEESRRREVVYRLREAFIHDASHELRTPLTVLLLEHEMLGRLSAEAPEPMRARMEKLLARGEQHIHKLEGLAERLAGETEYSSIRRELQREDGAPTRVPALEGPMPEGADRPV